LVEDHKCSFQSLVFNLELIIVVIWSSITAEDWCSWISTYFLKLLNWSKSVRCSNSHINYRTFFNSNRNIGNPLWLLLNSLFNSCYPFSFILISRCFNNSWWSLMKIRCSFLLRFFRRHIDIYIFFSSYLWLWYRHRTLNWWHITFLFGY
jgi:hypothetical protein